MAIEQNPLSVTFTATNDGVDLLSSRRVVGVTFDGTGLTAGQRLVLRGRMTPGTGSIIASARVVEATEDKDLWCGRSPQIVNGLSLDNTTMGGTWVVTVLLGDVIEPA